MLLDVRFCMREAELGSSGARVASLMEEWRLVDP